MLDQVSSRYVRYEYVRWGFVRLSG